MAPTPRCSATRSCCSCTDPAWPKQLPARASARPQLLHQQGHGLTQLQSAAGGVGEEESGLRNKASSLELSSASRLFSLLTRKISLSSALVRCSIACTGRQLSVDSNCRHRGSDAGDAPLLLEPDADAGEGDVVIGGEQSDQAGDQPADGLGKAEAVETPEGPPCVQPVCRRWRLIAVASWRVSWRRGEGHKPMPRPYSPVPPAGPAVSGLHPQVLGDPHQQRLQPIQPCLNRRQVGAPSARRRGCGGRLRQRQRP